jgi:hypothetical protein
LSQIRPLEPEDIPRIVALRRRVFSQSAQSTDLSLGSYYRALFFENPWRDIRFPSFVHEEADGTIRGFVGAIPRPMSLGGEPLLAVTTTELMVAPESRGFVGPALFRRIFSGAQDITISDRSNQQARTMYESLGGSTALWYSQYWVVTLDGTSPAFQSGAPRGRGLVALGLSRAGTLLSSLSTRFVPAMHKELGTHDEELQPQTVVDNIRKVAGPNSLVPDYDVHSLSWLLQRSAETSGRVVGRQVSRDANLIGWFIYTIRPGTRGEAEVVQLAAFPGRHESVFDHLLEHAASEGVRVLKGRLDRQFASVVSDRGIPLTLGQPWTVVRSKRPDVTSQFVGGTAFFSRLDAEWWIGT